MGAVAVSSALTVRLANVYALEGRTQEADALFDEAIADAERQRYVPTLALAYNLRGITLRRRGLLDEAERCHRDALALCVDRGAPAGLSLSLASLGYIAELPRRRHGAEQHHLASLDAACDADDASGPGAGARGSRGRGVAAAVTTKVSAATSVRPRSLREATGGALVEAERVDIERALDRVGDRAVMDAAFAAGHTRPAVGDRGRTRTTHRTS